MSSTSRRLQGIGLQVAKLASEIAVGDVLVWNYGTLSRVEVVRDVSKNFIEIDESCDGKVYPGRRLKKSRSIGWSPDLTANGVRP